MTPGNTRLARRLLWFAGFVDVALLCMLCSFSTMDEGWVWSIFLFLVVNASVGCYAVSQGLFFELRQERTWKAVCRGLGSNFVSERTRLYGNPLWVFGGSFTRQYQERMVPKLRDVHGVREGWTGTVMPFAGQTIEEYTKHSAAFALAFHVPFVTFDLADNGLIRVRAGQVPVPAAYDHQGQLAAPDHQPEQALLRQVPMARDLQGHLWYMPIESQHVFIAARTGGGKGSFIWSLVLGLVPAWRAGLVKFWGFDPKRLELAIGRGFWTHYADTAEDMVTLLEQCVREMYERGSQLQGKARKFQPGPENPLNVVVIDELGYITSMLPDKKLRARAEDAIVTLLSQGRAMGYAVVGAVQDPRKETVGFRDLFPICIAGGMPEPMVDLVLGKGMHDAGARCEQIPLGPAGAGVGYVISETSLMPLCIRAAWCDDRVIQQVLAHELAQKTGRADEQLSNESNSSQQMYQWGYRGE